MEIKTLTITKAHLDGMADAERAFFIHVGHIRNEIVTLVKVLKWSTHGSYDHPILIDVNVPQTFMFSRLLAGKLHEAWKYVVNAYIGEGLDISLGTNISADGQQAYSELTTYFMNDRNMMARIRDKIGFHYDVNFLKKGKDALRLDGDEKLKLYITKKHHNLYYHFSETFVGHAMLNSIHEGDFKVATKKFTKEIMVKGQEFMRFSDACIFYLIQQHFNQDEVDEDELTNILKDGEAAVPFFVE